MPRVDFLILTNHAEVRDGLLYLLGGGWNRHARTPQADGTMPASHFGIAVGIAFEPDDSRESRLWVRINHEDGTEIMRVEGNVEIRGETTPVTRLAISALNMNVRWPRPGTYHIMAGLGSAQPPGEKRFVFEVLDNA